MPVEAGSDVAGPPHSPAVWLFVPEVGLSDTPGEDPGEAGTFLGVSLSHRLPLGLVDKLVHKSGG
jgi:hypothetical protein